MHHLATSGNKRVTACVHLLANMHVLREALHAALHEVGRLVAHRQAHQSTQCAHLPQALTPGPSHPALSYFSHRCCKQLLPPPAALATSRSRAPPTISVPVMHTDSPLRGTSGPSPPTPSSSSTAASSTASTALPAAGACTLLPFPEPLLLAARAGAAPAAAAAAAPLAAGAAAAAPAGGPSTHTMPAAASSRSSWRLAGWRNQAATLDATAGPTPGGGRICVQF